MRVQPRAGRMAGTCAEAQVTVPYAKIMGSGCAKFGTVRAASRR